MHRFAELANNIWVNGQEGDASMGFQFDYQNVRWEEVRKLADCSHLRKLTDMISSYTHSSGCMTIILKVSIYPIIIYVCILTYIRERGYADWNYATRQGIWIWLVVILHSSSRDTHLPYWKEKRLFHRRCLSQSRCYRNGYAQVSLAMASPPTHLILFIDSSPYEPWREHCWM